MSQTTAATAATTTEMSVVESPCCHRRVLVEGWVLEFSLHNNSGVVQLRCGTVLDTPGWRRGWDHRDGCGELFAMDVSEVKVRYSDVRLRSRWLRPSNECPHPYQRPAWSAGLLLAIRQQLNTVQNDRAERRWSSAGGSLVVNLPRLGGPATALGAPSGLHAEQEQAC